MFFFPREHLTAPDTFIVGGESGEVDLAVMKNCDASIIGESEELTLQSGISDIWYLSQIDYGTYGLWGAVLAGGETVVSKRTFR